MAKKSRFVSPNELEKIDLGEGDWVEIPGRFSFQFVQEMSSIKDEKHQALMMLAKVIKAWNLTDEDGKDVQICQESISRLDTDTIRTITEAVTSKMSVPKASRPPFEKP